MSKGDRAGAVRFFLTNIYGAPRAFVAVMPILMRSAWKKNQSVAPTLVYDLTLLEDWSVLREGSTAVTIPTLVVGGEKSPAPLRDAVAKVARALPNARSVYLNGQDHNSLGVCGRAGRRRVLQHAAARGSLNSEGPASCHRGLRARNFREEPVNL